MKHFTALASLFLTLFLCGFIINSQFTQGNLDSYNSAWNYETRAYAKAGMELLLPAGTLPPEVYKLQQLIHSFEKFDSDLRSTLGFI